MDPIALVAIKKKAPLSTFVGHMILTVKLVSDKIEERKVEVSRGDTYERVLELLDINREEAIVLRNGKPVPEDDEVTGHAGEELTIIRIIPSG